MKEEHSETVIRGIERVYLPGGYYTAADLEGFAALMRAARNSKVERTRYYEEAFTKEEFETLATALEAAWGVGYGSAIVLKVMKAFSAEAKDMERAP